MTRAAHEHAIATATPYGALLAHVREASLLGSTGALLAWDQEAMMPPRGLEHRSRQLAQLASLQHRMITDSRLGEWLSACEADATLSADPLSACAVNVREIRREYDRQTRLPTSLVEALAATTSLAQHEWQEARRDSDFARFRPWLERILELIRAKADCLGWPAGGEPWDALADEHEPGSTAAAVEAVFVPLRRRLQALIGELTGSSTRPSAEFNDLPLPIEGQQRFVRFVSEQIGFDYTRGRLDQSAHPFCSGTHCHDVRLTTRFRDRNVIDALGSVMHESGHGIYEQGILAEHTGTPMGWAVSQGIHESQSRLWENQVGRSRAFWTWCRPQLAKHFGASVERYRLPEIYGAANVIEPGLIRTEADEATYNMHIMVRFEIERALVQGRLAASEVPGRWNELYDEYLGLTVPDDRRGCLQDIHWSSGSIGYFPTYTLGNLYAAQFFERASADLPDLGSRFERGEFTALREWLNRAIHAHGQRYRAADLCAHVTGAALSAEPLMRHLEGKLRPLYRR